jgi:ubiquinone/menaquinone biosynthesis C-methylase UbiE
VLFISVSIQAAMQPSTLASTQYLDTTSKLTSRIALYAYNKNPITWFQWLGTRLPLSGEVLEVGSGTGELWKHVDHIDTRLTLTDFSPAMCAQLRKLDLANVAVEQCNAAALPYTDGRFDGVVANHMIYHVDSPDAVLNELSRVLKPGGSIAVSMGEKSLNATDHEIGIIARAVGRPPRIMKASKINAGNAVDFLERYFRDVMSEVYPIELDVPKAEPVLDYLDSLEDQVMNEMQRDEAKRLIEAKIEEEGCFKVRMGTVLFSGTKM